GWAYVGVSAQKGGVEVGGGLQIDIRGFEPQPLKPWEPECYGTLSHPGHSYSFDSYSAVAQGLRCPSQAEGSARAKADMPAGLPPTTLIAAGESQSAIRMTTYVNAVRPVADTYDGFLIHSRGRNGAQPSAGPGDSSVPETVHIRGDLKDPVLQF